MTHPELDALCEIQTGAEMAPMLIDTGAAGKAGCFRGAWVRLDLPSMEGDKARHHITVSHRAIRGGLTKKAHSALPPLQELY